MEDVFGWLPLERGMAWQEVPVQMPQVAEVAVAAEPVAPPPPSPAVARGRKRGKRAATGASPAAKKRKVTSVPQISNLEKLLALQDADVVRLTVWRAVEGGPATPPSGEGDGLVIRVYLVPLDSAEYGNVEYVKGRRARPGAAGVLAGLGLVRVNQREWATGQAGGKGKSLVDDDDQRSLLELYHAIESPNTEPAAIDSLDTTDLVKSRLRKIAHRVPHTSTKLFDYQLASVNKMLAKELAPQLLPDPGWQLCHTVDGAEYWISYDSRVLREPRMVREPRGGILAEEMGSGKTLISLALILATRGELPVLEGTSPYLDDSDGPEPPVLTAYSRQWPYPNGRAERARGKRRVPALLPGAESWMGEIELGEYWVAKRAEEEEDRQVALREAALPLPSLRELCIDLVRTTSLAVPKLEGLGAALEDELNATLPSYTLVPSPAQLDTRRGRAQDIPGREIVAAATTLVVVPKGLCQQWAEAVEEHLEEGALKVLVLKQTTDKYTHLDLAANDGQSGLGRTLLLDYLLTGSRSPLPVIIMSARNFADAAENPRSPLRRVHFKRLMVDEGHVLGSDNATRTFADQVRFPCSRVPFDASS